MYAHTILGAPHFSTHHYITSSFVETLSRDDRGCDTPRRFHDSLRLWLWVCWCVLLLDDSCVLLFLFTPPHLPAGAHFPGFPFRFRWIRLELPNTLWLAGARLSSNTIFNALCSHHLTGILTLVHTLVIFALQLLLLVLIIFRFFFLFVMFYAFHSNSADFFVFYFLHA